MRTVGTRLARGEEESRVSDSSSVDGSPRRSAARFAPGRPPDGHTQVEDGDGVRFAATIEWDAWEAVIAREDEAKGKLRSALAEIDGDEE